MFEKVLFPTDFSERAETMLDCIAGIPQVREVILLHVVKMTRYPMGVQFIDTLAKETAESTLAEAQRYLTSLNPDIRVTLDTTISPEIAEGILTHAEQRGADLIVISAREKRVEIGELLGSVSSTILCRSKTNVLIMRHKIIETLTGKTYEKFCPMLFSRILCPIDFSRFSEHATALASTMKGVGELILIHVVLPEGGTSSEIKESEQAAEARIGAVRDSLAAQGIHCRAIVTRGDPAGEIIRIAEQQDVSVIWISSFGKGCLHDFLLGSTVQNVAMHSTRPVVVIRSWE